MKLGPIYILRTQNWLELMAERDRARDEKIETQKLMEQMQRALTALRGEHDATLSELATMKLAPATPPKPTIATMFAAMDGWTSQFQHDGQILGGNLALDHDPRLDWQLDVIGGTAGKRILELGPLEGAHTRVMCRGGANEVIAIEGFRDCWLRCLIVKEAFQLKQVQFLYGDFCSFVKDYQGPPFDFTLANGVLYHQTNPAKLIHDLARITDAVLVWSQVADAEHPGGPEITVEANGESYRGRVNHYGSARQTVKSYCGGVHPTAVWLYPDEMRRAFERAGFTRIDEKPSETTLHGHSLLFVARKPT